MERSVDPYSLFPQCNAQPSLQHPML